MGRPASAAATWRLLAVNATEDGQPCAVTSGCSLHLHGPTMRLPAYGVASAVSAAGLLVANGNAGGSLLPLARASLYVSADGGLAWTKVRAGPHLAAWGDSGAVLVAVATASATDRVLVSLDRGRTWRVHRFVGGDSGVSDGTRVRVRTLVAGRGGRGERFVVLGETEAEGKALAIAIDVAAVQPRLCMPPTQSRDASVLDYELWSPAAAAGTACVLGTEVIFHRRRDAVTCAVRAPLDPNSDSGGSGGWAPTVRQAHCACTATDYECDVGFETDAGACTPATGSSAWAPPATCPVGSSYMVPSGYRRVPANACGGGTDLTLQRSKPCPASTPRPSATGAPTAPSGGGGDDDGSSGTGLSALATVAVVGGVAAALILLMTVVVVWRRRTPAGGIRLDETDESNGSSRSASSWWGRWGGGYRRVQQQDEDVGESVLMDDI
jgi:hypothetical protein